MGCVRFGFATFAGKVLPFQLPPYGLKTRRTNFFGLDGESQIVGGRHARVIRIPMWIHADNSTMFPTGLSLTTWLEKQNTIFIGQTRQMRVVDDNRMLRYPPFLNCTFEGVETVRGGPIPDIAKGMGGGFICEVVFNFRQHNAVEYRKR